MSKSSPILERCTVWRTGLRTAHATDSGEQFVSRLTATMRCRAANVVTMRSRLEVLTEFLAQSRKGAKVLSLVFLCVFAALRENRIAVAQDPVETIRIDSDLVDLKVSVLGFNPNEPPPLLEPKDFLVLEDGVPQEISFFASADTPFDLVLLLDLSGSNSKNLKMIRNSAKRFVDAAREVDRIALVTFTDRPALYSTSTLDRRKLKKTMDEIDEAYGGTNFWDSMDWVLRDLIRQASGLRRSAIVVMTDGVDNALPGVEGNGSQTPFEELLERIRNSETLVFPIYLDTENENKDRHDMTPATYAIAREQLARIASTCGTPMYRAARLSDLDQ